MTTQEETMTQTLPGNHVVAVRTGRGAHHLYAITRPRGYEGTYERYSIARDVAQVGELAVSTQEGVGIGEWVRVAWDDVCIRSANDPAVTWRSWGVQNPWLAVELASKRGFKLYVTACKAWGLAHGYTGREGGWIYDAKGHAVCQGWSSLCYHRPLTVIHLEGRYYPTTTAHVGEQALERTVAR